MNFQLKFRSIIAIFLIFVTMLTCSCTAPRSNLPTKEQVLDKLTFGVSSREDVIALLGEPKSNEENYVYYEGLPYDQWAANVFLWFDKNKRLLKISYEINEFPFKPKSRIDLGLEMVAAFDTKYGAGEGDYKTDQVRTWPNAGVTISDQGYIAVDFVNASEFPKTDAEKEVAKIKSNLSMVMFYCNSLNALLLDYDLATVTKERGSLCSDYIVFATTALEELVVAP